MSRSSGTDVVSSIRDSEILGPKSKNSKGSDSKGSDSYMKYGIIGILLLGAGYFVYNNFIKKKQITPMERQRMLMEARNRENPSDPRILREKDFEENQNSDRNSEEENESGLKNPNKKPKQKKRDQEIDSIRSENIPDDLSSTNSD